MLNSLTQLMEEVHSICPWLLFPIMLNLLGDLWRNGEPNFDFLNNYSNIFLHLYNKKNGVPGRKMGHLTFISDDDEELKILFKKVSDEISKGYI